MKINEILTRLCYYDLRNPDNCIDKNDLTLEELNTPQMEGEDFANVLCSCDNCFYGRTKLALELLKYNKHKETNPFSEEDMIDFAVWLSNIKYGQFEFFNESGLKPFNELLQLWKEQKVETIYYQ